MASADDKPDRDGFLRRLESGQSEEDADSDTAITPKKTVRIDDSKPSVLHVDSPQQEDEVFRFLQEAGLGASPIDPSSLEALRELCTPKSSKNKTPSSAKVEWPDSADSRRMNMVDEGDSTPDKDVASTGKPPFSEIMTNPVLLRRVPSDLTRDRKANLSEMEMEGRTDATTDGSAADSQDVLMNQHKVVMEQLELQTALLMDVQRRLDELTSVVQSLSPNQQWQQNGLVMPHSAPPQMRPRGFQGPPAGAAGMAPQQNIPQQRQQEPAMLLLPQLTNAANAIMSIPARIRESRLAEMCHVFVEMHRRQVNIDLSLLFKIAFVFAIFSAKMGSTKRKTNLWNSYRFYAGIFFVTMGFLIKSGYLNFLYNFFVKQNVPARIWNGEPINQDDNNAEQGGGQQAAVAAQPPGQRADPPAAGGPNARPRGLFAGGADGFRNMFIGGGIQQRQPQQNPNNAGRHNGGVVGFCYDIMVFLGSFVLSILPMWKPEGIPHEAPEQQEEEQGEDAEHEHQD